MLRVSDVVDPGAIKEAGFRLYKAPTNMYSRGDFERPDFAPTTTRPMGIRTAWRNPGQAELLKRDEITELTPAGSHSTDVYPGVYPAPGDTQNIDYEDRSPRTDYRGDKILRSRSGVRGPAQYWKYGGMSDLAPVIANPVLFYNDPAEVAYQTYPGPFLGDTTVSPSNDSILTSLAEVVVGGLIAFVGPRFISSRDHKTALLYIGGFAGAIGVINLVSAIGREAASK